MALFEYRCNDCKKKFEQIRTPTDTSPVHCVSCDGTRVEKLISRFAVGGQGDLRESTMHGCHEAHVSTPMEGGGGHKHGPGCGHGGNGGGSESSSSGD